jgi:hypothetical protein
MPDRIKLSPRDKVRDKPAARDELRAAIIQRNLARTKCSNAAGSLGRADTALDAAQAEARKLVEDAHALVAAAEEAVRSGRPPALMPPNHQARALAAEAVATAATVRERLGQEHAACKSALAAAERTASDLAMTVLLDELDHTAARLVAAQQKVWALASCIRGAANLWLPSGAGPRPIPISRSVIDALEQREPQVPGNMPAPEAVAEQAWRAFYNRLLIDADAEKGDDL